MSPSAVSYCKEKDKSNASWKTSIEECVVQEQEKLRKLLEKVQEKGNYPHTKYSFNMM